MTSIFITCRAVHQAASQPFIHTSIPNS